MHDEDRTGRSPHGGGQRWHLGWLFALLLVGCAQTEPEVRNSRTGATPSSASSTSSDAAGSTSLLCRGGGSSKVTYDGKNATFAFERTYLPANKYTLQPGHCAWNGANMADTAPVTLVHAAIPQDTPWLKSAADSNTLITFQAADNKGGAISVQKCLAIDAAPGPALTLGWSTPIDSTKFGLAPNPKIDGKTLKDVVASAVAGRDDGQLCSTCHNKTSALGGYGAEVEASKASPIAPTDAVSGNKWTGPQGWAYRFIRNKTKPPNVKAAFQAWIDGGFAP